MDFLNHSEWCMFFHQIFHLSPLRNSRVSFEEIIISRQRFIVEVSVNSKEENSSDFCSDFVLRIRPQVSIQGTCKGLPIEKHDYSRRKCVKNCVLRSCCSAALIKKI